MTDSTYFIFKLNEHFFGIDVTFIEEILEIPELERPPETSSQLVGFLNFHGKMIEVLDSTLLLEFPQIPYSVNDFLVVLKGESFHFGLIIHDIVNIHTLSDLTEISEKQQLSFLSSHVAHFDGQLILILHPQLLIKKLDVLFEQKRSNLSSSTVFSRINEQDQHTLSLRAQNLKQPNISETTKEPFIPLMIIMLEKNYFGVDPETIREFIPINDFNPIPQAPPYLLGCVGFKGYVLTLLDIWPILKMEKLKIAPHSQALILNSSMIGIIVDKVIDLIYIRSNDLEAVPIGIEEKPFQSFTKYVVPYEGKIVSVLDIPKILESIN